MFIGINPYWRDKLYKILLEKFQMTLKESIIIYIIGGRWFFKIKRLIRLSLFLFTHENEIFFLLNKGLFPIPLRDKLQTCSFNDQIHVMV